MRFEPLPGDLQAERVQAGEGRQVGAREGSVVHVEVFQMAGVGTSILGRPRHLLPDRRADDHYTLMSSTFRVMFCGWSGSHAAVRAAL